MKHFSFLAGIALLIALAIGQPSTMASNHLLQSSFERDVEGWAGPPQGGSILWAAEDRIGGLSSGALAVWNVLPLQAPVVSVEVAAMRCVSGITAGSLYSLSTFARISDDYDPGGSGALRLMFSRQNDCTFLDPPAFGNFRASGPTGRTDWHGIQVAARAPVGARSVLILLIAAKTDQVTGDPRLKILFDDVRLDEVALSHALHVPGVAAGY